VGDIRYSQKAKADLLDIWLWIANDSVATADRILDEIECKANLLQDNREIGVARPDIAPQARSLVVARWLILYTLEPGGVRIVRVVDGARDLSKVFE
jgi:toxin ParE1/3/4